MPSRARHQERPEKTPHPCPQDACQLCRGTTSTKTDPQLSTGDLKQGLSGPQGSIWLAGASAKAQQQDSTHSTLRSLLCILGYAHSAALWMWEAQQGSCSPSLGLPGSQGQLSGYSRAREVIGENATSQRQAVRPQVSSVSLTAVSPGHGT